MKLQIICVAYEQPIHLRVLCDSFLLQTDHRWQLTVVHDGPPSKEIVAIQKLYTDPRIIFTHSPERVGSWGNENRREYLQNLIAEIDDYVVITNADNYYVPQFVEFVLQSGNMDTGIIYCNTVHNHLSYKQQVSELRVGGIDGGALIVSVLIAQKVGFKNNVGHADGIYAEECNFECIEQGLKTTHINKLLFVHN